MVDTAERARGLAGGGSTIDDAVAPTDVAAYIADMTEELGKLARAHRLDLLSYALDVARLEATARSRPARGPR